MGKLQEGNLFLAQLTEKSVCDLPLNTKIGLSKTGVKSSFSDKSKFNLNKSDRRTYVRRNSSEAWNPCCIQQTIKHGGGGVMVWGAFTFLELSTLLSISHRLDVQGYIQLLKDNLSPFLKEFPPGERVFQQENALIHIAKATSSLLVFLKISSTQLEEILTLLHYTLFYTHAYVYVLVAFGPVQISTDSCAEISKVRTGNCSFQETVDIVSCF